MRICTVWKLVLIKLLFARGKGEEVEECVKFRDIPKSYKSMMKPSSWTVVAHAYVTMNLWHRKNFEPYGYDVAKVWRNLAHAALRNTCGGPIQIDVTLIMPYNYARLDPKYRVYGYRELLWWERTDTNPGNYWRVNMGRYPKDEFVERHNTCQRPTGVCLPGARSVSPNQCWPTNLDYTCNRGYSVSYKEYGLKNTCTIPSEALCVNITCAGASYPFLDQHNLRNWCYRGKEDEPFNTTDTP